MLQTIFKNTKLFKELNLAERLGSGFVSKKKCNSDHAPFWHIQPFKLQYQHTFSSHYSPYFCHDIRSICQKMKTFVFGGYFHFLSLAESLNKL